MKGEGEASRRAVRKINTEMVVGVKSSPESQKTDPVKSSQVERKVNSDRNHKSKTEATCILPRRAM